MRAESRTPSPIAQGHFDDAALLAKINAALAAAYEAEKRVNIAQEMMDTARGEMVSHAKAVGLLLLEAKKLHPAVKDFEAFLKRVDGLKLSRAYDCMRIAGGRATDEELRQESRDRVRKHRANKSLPKPAAATAVSVTSTHVTESAEASAEKRKSEYAATDGVATNKTTDDAVAPKNSENKAGKASRNLTRLKDAVCMYMPKLNDAEVAAARAFVIGDDWKPKAGAA